MHSLDNHSCLRLLFFLKTYDLLVRDCGYDVDVSLDISGGFSFLGQ